MNAIEQLKSVLCGPDSKCCITGSNEDRAVVDSALEALAQPAQPAQVSEYECRKLLYGFMLDCNAVGLEQAGKNLHRSMKEKST